MISYSTALSYAHKISWIGYKDSASDLLHDTYLDLTKKGINLFEQSKRFVYRSIEFVNMNQRSNSMEGRHRVYFADVEEVQLNHYVPTPLDILISQELSETLPTELRLKVEGYDNREIGRMMGRTGQAIGHRIKLQKQRL